MAFKTKQVPPMVTRPSGTNYFDPPHGGRPPSEGAVREATARYCAAERAAMLQRPLGRDEMIRFNDFDERCLASFGGGWYREKGT